MKFTRCYGCMQKLESPNAECPKCGYDNTKDPAKQPSYALPCGTLLHEKYVVGKTLGQGGFGVTYIGWDMALETTVCIKEYFPNGAAMRDSSRNTEVYWSSGGNAEELRQGQESLLKEARKAVKLRNLPSVVTVWDVFYKNNTAYLVMDYIEGMTLKSYLTRKGKAMSEAECLERLAPVMTDLEKAHQSGIIHRDISPDNIMLRSDGKLILLDFGAAKDLSRGNGQTTTQTTTIRVAKKGFSPAEQYTESSKIGPWTDVYAMCATIAYCVTGKILPEALERAMGKSIDLSGFTPAFASVLEKGLAVRSEDRIQSMGELLDALKRALKPKPKPKLLPILGITAALLIAIAVIGWGNDLWETIINSVSNTLQTKEAEVSNPGTASADVTASTLESNLEADNIVTDVKVGSTVVFGAYEQDNDTSNGKEDIEWLVLAKEDDRFLVISKYALDCKPYNTGYKNVTWEICTLREWLNDTFLNAAFSEDERAMIPMVTVSADKNLDYSISPGNSTKDQIFLLSISEVNRYFCSDEARKCAPTDYAVAQRVRTSNSYSVDGKATCWWWLRSPGYDSFRATRVDNDGSISTFGNSVYYNYDAVRPALWIIMETSAETSTPKAEVNAKLAAETTPEVSSDSRALLYDEAEKHLANGEQIDAFKSFQALEDYGDARNRMRLMLANRVAAGGEDWLSTSVVVHADGTVSAAGDNRYGQCDVSDWENIVSVATSGVHTVGLRSDGTVVAVGDNDKNKCKVQEWADIVAIAVGKDYTVGLKGNGAIIGTQRAAVSPNSGIDCVFISSGVESWNALRSSGALTNTMWLGKPLSPGTKHWKISELFEGETDIVSFAISKTYLMGLRADGTVVSTDNRMTQCVRDWTDIVRVAASETHSVGLRDDGTVVAVLSPGFNYGMPCKVTDWKNIVAVAAGYSYTVGLQSDGTVVATGDNTYGQIDLKKLNTH